MGASSPERVTTPRIPNVALAANFKTKSLKYELDSQHLLKVSINTNTHKPKEVRYGHMSCLWWRRHSP